MRRYASIWARNQSSGASAAFVPLSFAPGEACQFDPSHEVVLIDGARTRTKASIRGSEAPAAAESVSSGLPNSGLLSMSGCCAMPLSSPETWCQDCAVIPSGYREARDGVRVSIECRIGIGVVLSSMASRKYRRGAVRICGSRGR